MNGMIYTRVSTKEQVVDRTSLASQEKECREFARKNNVFIKEECIFREEGESAKVANRPTLAKLLEYVRKHKNQIDILYIWKIDRLSRNLGDYYGIKVALSRYGVRIVSVTEPIDDDPVGRFLEAILAAAAQFDNEIRAIRTTGGMRTRVMQGGWPHQAPIGYTKKDGKVIPDKKYSSIITDILTTFSKGGYNLTQIAEYAFDKGITNKKGEKKTTDGMKRILQNQLYAGYTENKLANGQRVKGLHKALVSQDVIETNIDIITGRKRNYILKGDELYPLKSTLRCMNCGYKVRASAPRGRLGTYHPAYHCNQKTCRKSVTGKRASAPIETVHEAFRAILRSFTPMDEGVAKIFKKIVLKRWNEDYKQSLETRTLINLQLDEQRSLRHKATEKFIADDISKDERDMQHRAVDGKIAELEEELAEMTHFIEAHESVIDNAMLFMTSPETFWNQVPTPVKQMIQHFLFPDGIKYDFETGFGTHRKPTYDLLIKEIARKGDSNNIVVAATGIEPVTLGL